MFGTEMLIDALLNTVGIDKAQATALFQRIHTEAPELLASIRAFVDTTNKRLENIETALTVLVRDHRENDTATDRQIFRASETSGPEGDNFICHEHKKVQ